MFLLDLINEIVFLSFENGVHDLYFCDGKHCTHVGRKKKEKYFRNKSLINNNRWEKKRREEKNKNTKFLSVI